MMTVQSMTGAYDFEHVCGPKGDTLSENCNIVNNLFTLHQLQVTSSTPGV